MTVDNAEEISSGSDLGLNAENEGSSQVQQEFNALSVEAKFERLNRLVQQSQIYSQVMLNNMLERAKEKTLLRSAKSKKNTVNNLDGRPPDNGNAINVYDSNSVEDVSDKGTNRRRQSSRTKRNSSTKNSKKMPQQSIRNMDQDQISEKSKNGETAKTVQQRDLPEATGNMHEQQQPKLVTGCTMKDYQLEGLEWLVSLYENGLNGILADEMGLGKTLQCIALYAHLLQHGVKGPFLVVAPLSTVTNWCNEIQKFAPTIRVLKYVGSKDTRATIKFGTDATETIVVTSYEIIIRDFKKFSKVNWEYLTVDEGHRLKNFQSVLIRHLKKLQVGNRLLLTGTPLQNNLQELWSLLNFILPDIFHDLDLFESWFDFDRLTSSDSDDLGERERLMVYEKIQTEFVKNLHSILQPFLLRRVKDIVIKELPPKKEYVIFANLTPMQDIFYQGVTDGRLYATIVQLYLKEFLLHNHRDIVSDVEGLKIVDRILHNRHGPKKSKKRKRVNYNDEVQSDEFAESDDDLYSSVILIDDSEGSSTEKGDHIESLRAKMTVPAENERKQLSNASVTFSDPDQTSEGESCYEASREKTIKGALRTIESFVKSLPLQNGVMQLRSICASHYTYYEPFPFETVDESHDFELADLVFRNSGKVQLLEQITDRLLADKHKVLIFSQFTRVLDLLALHFQKKEVKFSRLDGRMNQVDRSEEIDFFSTDEDQSSQIFLLSTRAGGLGLNLVHADTVILFDNDWNPQMDLQAIDRVHRIGQTKPVKIYRFVVRNTIEELLIMKSFNKRALERAIIESGQFQLGQMAKKLVAENIDLSAIKSFKSMFDLGRRLQAQDTGPEFLDETRINSILLNKYERKIQLLEPEEIEELMDRSSSCYERNSFNSANMVSFETTNNMDK